MRNLKQFISNNVYDFIVISLAYIACYTLTSGLIIPIQGMLTSSAPVACLLFIPHGIRILTAYYYGWKALPLLQPSVYLMWYVDVYGNEILISPIQPIIHGVCCVVSFKLICRAIKSTIKKEWHLILIAGSFASVSSALITNFILDINFFNINTLQFIIGDIAGQIALMIMLIYLFKFSRIIIN